MRGGGEGGGGGGSGVSVLTNLYFESWRLCWRGGGHVNKSSIANLKCLKFNCISAFYFYF